MFVSLTGHAGIPVYSFGWNFNFVKYFLLLLFIYDP